MDKADMSSIFYFHHTIQMRLFVTPIGIATIAFLSELFQLSQVQ